MRLVAIRICRSTFKGKELTQGTAEFFRLNDRKLEALIKATTDDKIGRAHV